MEKKKYSKMTPEELSQAINLVRTDNAGVFKAKDITKALKTLGVPMAENLTTVLIQQGIIVKAGLSFIDGYTWANDKPIYVGRVSDLIVMARKRAAAYCKKSREKKKAIQNGTYKEEPKNPVSIEEEFVVEPAQEHKELVPVDKAINKAIQLLLNHGYKVTRPVIIYEEVTIKNL